MRQNLTWSRCKAHPSAPPLTPPARHWRLELALGRPPAPEPAAVPDPGSLQGQLGLKKSRHSWAPPSRRPCPGPPARTRRVCRQASMRGFQEPKSSPLGAEAARRGAPLAPAPSVQTCYLSPAPGHLGGTPAHTHTQTRTHTDTHRHTHTRAHSIWKCQNLTILKTYYQSMSFPWKSETWQITHFQTHRPLQSQSRKAAPHHLMAE